MEDSAEDIHLNQTEFSLLGNQLRFLFKKRNRLEQRAKEINDIMTKNPNFTPYTKHKEKTVNMLDTLLETGEGNVEDYLSIRQQFFNIQCEFMPMINRMEQIGIEIKTIVEDIQEIEKKFSKLSGARYIDDDCEKHFFINKN